MSGRPIKRTLRDEGLGQACVVRDQAVTNNRVGIVAGHVRFMQQSPCELTQQFRHVLYPPSTVAGCMDTESPNTREGIVKLRLTAVFDTQHGGFATG